MKKFFIMLLLIATGVGVYKLIVGEQTDVQQLSYVPADTPVFSAQLKPIDIQTYLASLGVMPNQMNQMSEIFKSEMPENQSPNYIFFISLFDEYVKAISTPSEFANITGMNLQLRSLFYMVGASPVIQIELSEPAKFLALFDRAQQASNITYSQENLDGVPFHRYVLDQNEGIELLIRASENWGVITLHSTKFDNKHLKTSLAMAKPDEDIVSSGKFKSILEEYQLSDAAIGFVSTEQLGLTATTIDGNSLAKDLYLLGGDDYINEFADIRTPACQDDVAMLTAMWPGVFMDSDISMDSEQTHIKARVLVPTTSKVALENLRALRGFIPAYASGISSGLFHMAVGTDVASLSTSVNKMWSAITNLEVTCEPLVAMQQELLQNNPTGAFAMAGIASGFMGLGASVSEIDLSEVQAGKVTLDAVLSVSAGNVRTLYGSLQTFVPFLAGVNLPQNGEELVLNEMLPMLDQFALNVTAMATDEHLVLFTGDKGREQASQTLSEELKKNGMVSFAMDYKELFSQMLPLMEMSGQPLPPGIDSMMETNMALSVQTDVSQKGIEVTTEMSIKK